MFILSAALAVIAGLFGAVIGSAHPIASALVSAFAGALVAGVTMVFCIVTMPHHVFGVRNIQYKHSVRENIIKIFFYCAQEREIMVSMGGGAIIFAVITLICAKFITIVSSSIVGTAMIVASVDFFMHGLKTVEWVNKYNANKCSQS